MADLKMRSFGVSSLMHEVVEAMRSVAEAKNVFIEVASPGGNPAAWADRDKITQVLTNLIDNAVKFTPRGGKVSLSLEPLQDSHWLCLSITDSGPGISAARSEAHIR